MSLLIPGTNSIKDTGYNVANSLRFDNASSQYLNESQASGNRRTFTWSCWYKRGVLGSFGAIWHCNNAGHYSYFAVGDDDDIQYYDIDGASQTVNYKTNRVLRDPSAWTHLVLRVDTTQGTEADRIRFYVNGVQETSFSVSQTPSQNTDLEMNVSGHTFRIGTYNNSSSWLDGYLAECVFCDGQSLDPTSFGEFDSDSPNIWKPIDVTGLTFGTNGFYLDFEDGSSVGKDVSGQGNNFTATNMDTLNRHPDTCTNNFAVMNNLIPNSNITYSRGNLRVKQDSVGNNRIAVSTIAVSAGKWYVEHRITQHQDATHTGIVAADSAYSVSNSLAQMENAYAYKNDGNVQEYNQSNIDTGEATYTAGDIIGIALDMDNNKLYFHKNGTYLNSGDPAGNSNGYSITSGKEYYFAKAQNYAKHTDFNFGSPTFTISSGNADGNGFGNFEYAVPSGFLAVCTKNLGSDGG